MSTTHHASLITGALVRTLFVYSLAIWVVVSPATGQTAKSYKVAIEVPYRAPVSLHVEEQGTGRPIVLLHGLGASTYMWRHLAPPLAKEHRVIAIDLKGFGRSDKPVDFNYRIEDHAALVRGLIVKLALDNVTLVGHSFGGAVALLLAVDEERRGDRRISRLVLMNTPAFEQSPSLAISVLRLPLVPYVLLPILTPEFGARAILTPVNGDATTLKQRDIDAYAQPLREPGALHALIETGRGVEPEKLEEVISYYHQLQQPSLIIWCRHDPTVPLAIGQRLARTLPRATMTVFDTCRHVPPEQSIRETERRVLSFLRKWPLSSADNDQFSNAKPDATDDRTSLGHAYAGADAGHPAEICAGHRRAAAKARARQLAAVPRQLRRLGLQPARRHHAGERRQPAAGLELRHRTD